jgi:hypothetical protein
MDQEERNLRHKLIEIRKAYFERMFKIAMLVHELEGLNHELVDAEFFLEQHLKGTAKTV